jgi:hypothetical protein
MFEGQAFPLAPPNGLAFAAWTEPDLEQWLDQAGPPSASGAGRARLRRAAEIVRELGCSILLDPLTRREILLG